VKCLYDKDLDLSNKEMNKNKIAEIMTRIKFFKITSFIFQVGEPKKPHIEGLNPVTGRPLWLWSDEGYRRPGSKGKAKKLFHRAIKRGPEQISVGDCAVFLSTARVDRPYIGQVKSWFVF
jgi:hypothetical protein